MLHWFFNAPQEIEHVTNFAVYTVDPTDVEDCCRPLEKNITQASSQLSLLNMSMWEAGSSTVSWGYVLLTDWWWMVWGKPRGWKFTNLSVVACSITNPAYGRQIISRPMRIVAPIPKQDRNSTYRCAIWGLRIYNLFNLFSLPIHSVQIWVTFQFEWHSHLSKILSRVIFQFEWHFKLGNIHI